MNPNWRLVWRRILAGLRIRREPAVSVPKSPDQGRRALEARIALGRSQAILNRVESNEHEVDRLHTSMRKLHEENGFAALIYRSLGGRG